MADVKIRVLSEDKTRGALGKVDSGLRGIATAFGFVASAAFTAKKAFDFAEEAAQFERLAESGQMLASQFDQDMGAVVESIQKASGGTIDAMTAMQAANNAMVLDVAKSPEEFEKLTTAAVALGRATGRTAEESIQDLTTGVGRQSRMILDNLGIVVDAERDYANYAESIGKTAEQLTDAEKKQALLNKAIEAAQPLLDENGELIGDDAAEYEKLRANTKDYTSRLKQLIGDGLTPVVRSMNDHLDVQQELDHALEMGIITEYEYERAQNTRGGVIMTNVEILEMITEAEKEYWGELQPTIEAAEDADQAMLGYADALVKAGDGTIHLSKTTEDAVDEMREVVSVTEKLPENLQLTIDALENDWTPAWAEAGGGPQSVLRTLELIQARMESIARLKFAPKQIPVNLTGSGAELMLGGKLLGGGQGGQFGPGITFDRQGTNTLEGSEDALAEKIFERFGGLQ